MSSSYAGHPSSPHVVLYWFCFILPKPWLNSWESLLVFGISQAIILWGKEAVFVRQMVFHIPWGTVPKQPTQMYNLGTNMNHQPDTSPSHSKISRQTSQYVPQIQGAKRVWAWGRRRKDLASKVHTPQRHRYSSGKKCIWNNRSKHMYRSLFI